MIITFKTNKEVIVSSRTSEKSFVYLDIYGLQWNGETFVGDCQYYYFLKDGGRMIIESVSPKFTNEEADSIEKYIQITGTLSETLLAVCISASKIEIGEGGYFQTEASDWEVYIEPKITPIEETESTPIEEILPNE